MPEAEQNESPESPENNEADASASETSGDQVAGKIAKASMIITGIILLCKILGAAEKFLLVEIYDQKRFHMDLYLALAVLAVLFYDIMRYAVIPTLLPALVRLQESEGEERAMSLASSFVNGLFLASIPLLTLSLLWPEGLIGLFINKDVLPLDATQAAIDAAQTKYDYQITLGRTLLRIMTPAGLLLVWGGVFYCILHSRKRFAASAFGDFAYKLLSLLPLIGVIGLAKFGGQEKWVLENGVYYIALGVSAGAFGLFTIQGISLRQSWRYYRFKLNFGDPEFKKVLRLSAWPLLYALLFIGARRVLDIYFGFGFNYKFGDAGYYSGLEFSYRLVEFPFRFLIEPLAYAIFPFLVAQRTAGDLKGFSKTLDGGLRSAILVLIPMSALLFLLRDPVAGVLKPELVEFVSLPLAFYSLGILGFGLELLLTRAVFALDDQRSPALLEVLALGIYLTLVLTLRDTSLKHASVAVAFSVSRTAKAIAMFIVLSYRNASFDLSAWKGFALKVVIAGAVTCVVAWAARQGSAGVKPGTRIGYIVQVGAGGVAGGLTYLAFLWILKVSELQDLLDMLLKRKKSG